MCQPRTTKEICTYTYGILIPLPEESHTRQKKGIALTLEKWKKLTEDCIGDIDKALDDLKQEDANVSYKEHLGHNVHVTVDQEYGFVDIRKWWLSEKVEMIVATRKGISLTVSMWKELKKTIPVIRKRFQKELDSNNQMSMLECPSCIPDELLIKKPKKLRDELFCYVINDTNINKDYHTEYFFN